MVIIDFVVDRYVYDYVKYGSFWLIDYVCWCLIYVDKICLGFKMLYSKQVNEFMLFFDQEFGIYCKMVFFLEKEKNLELIEI